MIEKLLVEKEMGDGINREIKNRDNSFYWQTDRDVDPREAGKIWANRHEYFTDEGIIEAINLEIGSDELVSLTALGDKEQTSLGNVNSVRTGKLQSGREVIIRNHPTGIENGYFHVESLASSIAKKNGIPSYDTLVIHDLENEQDHSFQVIEKITGIAIKNYLEKNPEAEKKMLFEIGRTMAKLHQIKVDGFGPFDNEKAKNGELQGIYNSYEKAVNAGLDFNIGVLEKEELVTLEQLSKIKRLFKDNELLKSADSVLIHNDFADWNLLTDGEGVTGVLDFDECVGGDPVSDIACWSTFFAPERLNGMLEGYWSVNEKPNNFEEKFELLRLRYVISKMTLRSRRYSWDPSEFMAGMIDKGKVHLKESLDYFGIKE